ncbi:hypothetical protein HBI88_243320 [Parastagonospora nodorum]|nr:hypothetical protein HBI97_243080 [Parastagonospora nodorum]KAH5783168.1 hypothetical protein HBI96_243480 [Parastagonospora nodorum]KAH5807005.1 hypothetical protein HBI93_243650 [Parastagonospora nodorum]KAH5889479.1 hypothetical protein HBI89_242960 [Parastagonospora nodorum]KAH5893713.1 hypothetical protein HBI88_243320 [Parastagonospora nodorum]
MGGEMEKMENMSKITETLLCFGLISQLWTNSKYCNLLVPPSITIVVPHQIHVRLVGNVFRVSTCSEPDKDKWSSCLTTNRDIKAYAGYERGSCVLGGLQWVPRATWARHLDSSWGPHWMCEEDLENRKFDVSLLLSCMKTYTEIRNWMSRTAITHVTDLETLAGLGTNIPAPSPDHLPIILVDQITHLSLTLRMPLRFFYSIEALQQYSPSSTEQESWTAQFWTQIDSILEKFTSLTVFRLWVDHCDPEPWSLVNERILLSPLLSHLPHSTKVIIVLPRLHPVHEHPDGDFLPGQDELGNVHLFRKLRLRCRSTINPDGDVDVVDSPDFPLLKGLWEGEKTATEEETWEREQWIEGHDVDEMARQMVEISQ